MTYSYATKVWVNAHLNKCIFGRETIAWAAKIRNMIMAIGGDLDPDKMCRVTTFLMGDCKPFEFDWDKSDLSA